MPSGDLWEVVGGQDKGGIFVRIGKGSDTPPQIHNRIAFGAILQEVLLEDDRLCFNRLHGKGPNFGWVSLKLQSGKELVRKYEKGYPQPEPRPPPTAIKGRKLRILALHGAAANSNIVKFQLNPLKQLLGKQVEWLFVEAPLAYDDYMIPGSHDPLFKEPDEIEKKIAGKKPFMLWYEHGGMIFNKCKEGADHLKKGIMEQLPIDCIVAYSQAANQVTMLLDDMRKNEETDIPWKLQVFFCGGQVDDPKWQFDDGFSGPYAVPTIRVYNAAGDDYFAGGEPNLGFTYPDILEIPHHDGHGFPSTQPRAGEIFKQVAEEIQQRLPVE